jgi:hypothetical protein
MTTADLKLEARVAELYTDLQRARYFIDQLMDLTVYDPSIGMEGAFDLTYNLCIFRDQRDLWLRGEIDIKSPKWKQFLDQCLVPDFEMEFHNWIHGPGIPARWGKQYDKMIADGGPFSNTDQCQKE